MFPMCERDWLWETHDIVGESEFMDAILYGT